MWLLLLNFFCPGIPQYIRKCELKIVLGCLMPVLGCAKSFWTLKFVALSVTLQSKRALRMQCGEESVLEEHSTSLPPLGVSTWHSGWHQEELHFLRTYKNEVSGQVSRSSGSLLPGHILERCGHPSFSWRMLAKMTHIHSTLQFLVLGSDKAHAGWKASHVYSSLERDCWCLESWVRKWDNFFPETQEIMLVLPWFQSGVISS